MPERHLLPIPLPHGRSGKTGFLTVYFAPRLRERGPLSAYPEWERWADTVNALAITVEINGVPQVPTRVTPLAEPAAWQAVFADDTPVSGHRPKDWRPLGASGLQIGPGGDFSEAILNLYAAFAKTYPAGPPPGDEVLALPEAEVLTSDGAAAATDYVTPMRAKHGERLEQARDPEWDFHEFVTLLGHHPQLLRILGIAVELEVDLPVKPVSVRVHTNYDNGVDRRAVDFVMATTPDFWAAPNTDPKLREQDQGFLRLAEQGAFLTILDVKSSADRLRNLDARLPGQGGALPALRTRALTLVRPDLVTAFKNRTERQWDIEESIAAALLAAQPQPVPIFAEDVAIGHIIDVFEPQAAAAVWRSLFERQTDAAGYHFPADPTALDRVPEPDEGWTTTTLVTELVEAFDEPDPDNHDPFVPFALRRLDDQLYRWDGWSGAVRPPGSAVDGAGGGVAAKQPGVPPVDFPVQFAAHYEVVPGSLPRLRFGTEYLMRARCVDLSGDARPIETPVPPSALPPAETFGRLEPIAAPFVVRRRPRPVPGVGDHPTTIVLRSDYDVDDETVAPQERLLFPGQVGQDLCELHGEPNGGVDAASYRLLASRDAREPDDPWATDPVIGEPIADGRRRQLVRYLSDPLIGRLRAFHHAEAAEHLASIGGAWPAVNSARLDVVAGAAPTQVNPDDVTELRIGVAKADIHTLDLSYAPAEGGVEEFGLWHQLGTADQAALRPAIDNGSHWMFSARVPLQLVHAVRRPLLPPQVVTTPEMTWTASREVGSTGVTFSTTVEIERRSTARLTLAARWVDLVDDPRADGPELRRGGAPLGRYLTPRDTQAEPRFEIVEQRAELGDTRRHAATIDLEAFSSFSAYFTEERAGPIRLKPTVIDRRGFAGATVSVATADGTVATEGTDYTVGYDAGTIAAVRGGRFGDGDAVTVRYVPLPVSRTSAEPGLEPFEFVFPSTKAPPPPKVVDVVPAFARQRSPVVDGEDVTHDGNVLRVYLARPWNVSGDGERLAVLVERSPGDVPAATCVGRDPIVTGSTTALDASAFSRSTAVVESPDGVHDLALHDVQYDAVSRRWFADIVVDTPIYRPFLRLVLARYQVDSVAGQQLSSSAILDPIRLGVKRTVSVRAGAAADEFDVTVSGPDHGGMAADDGTATLLANELVVVHQRADAAIADPDLRWRIDVSTAALPKVSTNGVSTWSATIAAPPDGTPRRLVIEEREPALTGLFAPTVGGEPVYTETVELPA
jgi:hypothetical protein